MLFLAPPVQEPTIVTLSPSDDVWVYPHSSNPAGDEMIRVWGAGGRAVAADAVEAEDFSYGYLRFTLPPSVRGARIVGATLQVTNVANDNLGPDELAANPLQVRPLVGDFTEKTWTYSAVGKIHPDPKAAWGQGLATPVKGAPTEISIDLMSKGVKGVDGSGFLKAFRARNGVGEISLALTSAVDAAVTPKSVYKVYSKEAEDKSRRPRLVLKLGETG